MGCLRGWVEGINGCTIINEHSQLASKTRQSLCTVLQPEEPVILSPRILTHSKPQTQVDAKAESEFTDLEALPRDQRTASI